MVYTLERVASLCSGAELVQNPEDLDVLARLGVPGHKLVLLGNGAVGKLLVASQVVLSLQLPFALYPLIRMTNDRRLMGDFTNRLPTKLLAWLLFVVISAANLWLVGQTIGLIA